MDDPSQPFSHHRDHRDVVPLFLNVSINVHRVDGCFMWHSFTRAKIASQSQPKPAGVPSLSDASGDAAPPSAPPSSSVATDSPARAPAAASVALVDIPAAATPASPPPPLTLADLDATAKIVLGRLMSQIPRSVATVATPATTPQPWRPRGLLNSKNVCFANAVWQALLACDPFTVWLASIRHQVDAADAIDRERMTAVWERLAAPVLGVAASPPGASTLVEVLCLFNEYQPMGANEVPVGLLNDDPSWSIASSHKRLGAKHAQAPLPVGLHAASAASSSSAPCSSLAAVPVMPLSALERLSWHHQRTPGGPGAGAGGQRGHTGWRTPTPSTAAPVTGAAGAQPLLSQHVLAGTLSRFCRELLGQQHDAPDFLAFLVDALHVDVQAALKSAGGGSGTTMPSSPAARPAATSVDE